MNFKTTLILLVLLLVVGGLTIYVHNSHKETPPTPPVAETNNAPGKPVFDIKAADVDAITIKPADGEEIALKRAGSDWRLTKPVAAPAIGIEVDQILTPLLGMRTVSQVDPSQATGLTPAKYTITLSTTAGKTFNFSIGDPTALGDGVYIRQEGSGMADVVSMPAAGFSLKSLNDLRDKTLVHTSSEKIEQLVLERPDSPKIVLHKEDGKWREIEPLSFRADPDVISRVLGAISMFQANSFVKGSISPSVSKLDKPQEMVSFSTTPAATQPSATPATAPSMTVIRLGQFDTIRKENVYATVSDSPEVVKVSASRLDDFKQSPLEFRDKELVNIDPERVAKFTIAINQPATTQPTTKPAETREFTIERHKAAAPILGPALPADPSPAATHPAGAASSDSSTPASSTGASSLPTTQPAVATTQPAAPGKQSTIATTQPSAPTTQPAVATTQPSAPATQPSVATTQPDEAASAKWLFTAGGAGPAEEGQVADLLAGLHPLRVEKYIDPANAKGAMYVLTIHEVPAKAADNAEDFVFTFIDTGTRVVGLYKDLQFEVNRSLIEKLTGDFKTKKAAPPEMPPSMRGGGSPFGGGGSPFGG